MLIHRRIEIRPDFPVSGATAGVKALAARAILPA
jgi:hypothetical protein